MRLSFCNRLFHILTCLLICVSSVTHAASPQPSFQINSLHSQDNSIQIPTGSGPASVRNPELDTIAEFINSARQRLATPSETGRQTIDSAPGLTVQPGNMSNVQVRLSDAKTPRQIKPVNSSVLLHHSKPTGQQSSNDINLQSALNFLNTSSQMLRLDNPGQELKLIRTQTDQLGKVHLRFNQYYQNLPVWNSALTVHMNHDGDVELVDGAYFPTPKKLNANAVVSAAQALLKARHAIPHGTQATAIDKPRLVIYPDNQQPARLVWEIQLSASLDQHWLILIDAHSGAYILSYNQVNDAATTGTAQDLFGEQQLVNLYQSGSQFFMADTSKPMYQGASPFPIKPENGVIYILDDQNQSQIDSEGEVQLPDRIAVASSSNRNSWPQDAVSAASSLSATYDYYTQVHSRNSIDGNGGSIFAIVRIGNNYRNAFWNGQVLAFGDAIPFAGALDVVGHELTHGVIQNTSNLIYLNQSGALNEAFSDILGEAIEAHTFGQADWVVGGQLGSPLRSLSNPGSLNYSRNRAYPATMSEFVNLPPTPEGDLGGIHINSSIINHAFYQLAEGLNGAIGIDQAEQIFYRALVFHLVPRSNFLDARLAVIQSAAEIYGDNSTQAQKAAEAFDAVEIFNAPVTPQPNDTSTVVGPDSTVYIEFDSISRRYFLKRREPSLNDPSTGSRLSFLEVSRKRPSVDRNSGLIAFIDVNHHLCLISSRSTQSEQCLDSSIQVNSIAVSSDGEKFALVFRNTQGEPENSIAIIDLDPSTENQTIELVAPATEGASTTTILNADAMDFTNNGQTLIYDAFNEINIADGSKIGVWSIYAYDLINQTIIALVPPVKGFHFAFPALSQTNDNFITFDALNLETGINTVTAASLITGESHPIHTSGDFGTPSYLGDDSAIVFSQVDPTTATGFSLVRQPLKEDKITPLGNTELWLRNADYGVIYRRGNSITTPSPNTQPVAREGLWWIPSKPGSGFDIQITSNNDLFLVWYTYTVNGLPIWYLASGSLDNNKWRGDLFEFTWNGSAAISNRAGDAELTFTDNTHARLEWTLNTGNGSSNIEYFAFDNGETRSTGTWFEAAQPGYGVTHVTQGSTQVNVLYFYDQAGKPTWSLGSGPSADNTTVMNSFDGTCPVCPFENSNAFPSGNLSISLINDLNGRLSTNIDLTSPLSGSWSIDNAAIKNLSE